MPIPVKLETFEGPLDLLLHLIDKNKMNIFDIPIVEITTQYMEYIKIMDLSTMDVMSEFLVMAATLLRIKSQLLLPQEEREEEVLDPRAELVERLSEYKMYKYASLELKDKQLDAGHVLFKKPTIPDELKNYKETVDPAKLLSGLTLAKLEMIFEAVMKRREDKVDKIRSSFGKIEKEEVNLSVKIMELQNYGLKHRRFSFKKFLERQHKKMDIIVSFLGILELMKIGCLTISQQNLFDDIEVSFTASNAVSMEGLDLE